MHLKQLTLHIMTKKVQSKFCTNVVDLWYVTGRLPRTFCIFPWINENANENANENVIIVRTPCTNSLRQLSSVTWWPLSVQWHRAVRKTRVLFVYYKIRSSLFWFLFAKLWEALPCFQDTRHAIRPINHQLKLFTHPINLLHRREKGLGWTSNTNI